ncbi:MAG: hypothetical protein QOE05_965, partial [Actinomycetota bacterium]|nr:hypothetical protein [Actinomycetota bacterium]
MLTSVGRISGLLSAYLLLVQVLLIARVPVIERSYGQDELARRHRVVGFTSFNLLLTHIGFVTIGYAVNDGRNPIAEAWHLVWTYPGMLLATAGSAALVMVVITSIRAARSRLRYESWHLLHLYAYVGVGLALPHQLWTGTDFLSSPGGTAFWWTAYAAVATCVLVFRVGLPAYRTLRHRPVVGDVVREAPGVVSLHINGRDLDRLPLRAGQFFIWRFLDGPGWTRGHPLSVSAAPDGRPLRMTVKELGAGTGRLQQVRPGSRVLLEGPYGRLTADARTRRTVTALAAGIGITPLRALLEELSYRPGEATLVYRASSPNEFLFRDEIDALARARGIDVFYVAGPRRLDRPSWLPRSATGVADSAGLLQLAPRIADSDVFICGPDEWMAAAVAAVRGAGVPESQLHLERFSW